MAGMMEFADVVLCLIFSTWPFKCVFCYSHRNFQFKCLLWNNVFPFGW